MSNPFAGLGLNSESIWLPGRGSVSIRETQAQRAVQEYSHELRLGFHKENEEWIVLKELASGEYFPVFGLGRELPTPEQIKERLYKADTRRRGGEIVREIDKRNEARKKELRDKAGEGTGLAA